MNAISADAALLVFGHFYLIRRLGATLYTYAIASFDFAIAAAATN